MEKTTHNHDYAANVNEQTANNLQSNIFLIKF